MTVQIQFDSKQEFQIEAISSIVDLFQSPRNLLPKNLQKRSDLEEEALFQEIFFSNRIMASKSEIEENLKEIQSRTRLSSDGSVQEIIPSEFRFESEAIEELEEFSIEMETGTGKTYVYLRTAIELYLKYGLSKFVIVVPTVAIREGVLSTLRLTSEHFKEIYSGLQYDAYVYDSRNISKLRQFAASSHLQILIMNIAAFNRDENIIRRETDGLNGRAPIDFVQAVRPVVILDEPQKLSSELSSKAIDSLKPILKFRYSATHTDYINLVYRLSPIDAYDMRLVKKIDVLSLRMDENLSSAYVRVEKITAKSRSVSATISISKNGKLTQIHVKQNDDLEEITGSRIYSGWIVEDIHNSTEDIAGYIEFTNGKVVSADYGNDTTKDQLHRAQIRSTIQDHFETELLLKRKSDLREISPTKALTLFFIDKVDNYIHAESKFRVMFTQEYENVSKMRKFRNLDFPPVENVHKGYFASSKNGIKDSKEGRSNKEDEEAYDLIMKNKERLLSLEEPARFIFSHSALAEGWDNPNVFTLCSLQETKSAIRKRQQIGRGLRLPVMSNGERSRDEEVNHLTVIATESFESFASSLQKELHEEVGIDFLDIVQDKRERVEIAPKPNFMEIPGFTELWNHISRRTSYRLEFDSQELVEECVRRFKNHPKLVPPLLHITKHEINRIDLLQGIVEGDVRNKGKAATERSGFIPDFLADLSNVTPISRASIAKIVSDSGRLPEIEVNPVEFISQLKASVFGALANTLKNHSGVIYKPLSESDSSRWSVEFISSRIAVAYSKSLVEVKKSIYASIPVDSEIERQFAIDLDKRDDIELFIKLPSWFKVQTPVGAYNPDWAIVQKDGRDDSYLYLVRETKGSSNLDDLFRESEVWKVVFGGEHFKSIDVNYKLIKKASELELDEYLVLPGEGWHGIKS